MVTFDSMGRLANHLYQAAACIAYSISHNVEYTIPHRERDPEWHPVYLKHLRKPSWNPSLPLVNVNEEKHSYHRIPFKEEWRSGNICLVGYFQSYRYFDWCMDEIYKAFGYKFKTEHNVCALHVRRGDFLLYPQKHIQLPVDGYYLQAIQQVTRRMGIYQIKVFSDDIPYCKSAFEPYEDMFEEMNITMSYNEGNSPEQDFVEMASCEALVAANSSYSILAGTLNPSPDRIVIAPHYEQFFGPSDKHLDVSTMYPPDFIMQRF